jgi:hypothetical protein
MMIEVFRPKMIKVSFNLDRCGNMTIKPLSKKIQEKMIAHLQEYYSIAYTDPDIFINEGFDTEQYMDDFKISKHEWKHMEKGWSVVKLVDPELFANQVGYDFAEVI